jgi:tRNA wybutosine-synthesizing protein 1
MKRNGVFHTWIDYPKFHELIASGEQFTAADYMAPTPDWAIFNPVRACRDPTPVSARRRCCLHS